MNTIIQNILVVVTVFVALIYLVKKYWPSKVDKKKSSCGDNNCGCH